MCGFRLLYSGGRGGHFAEIVTKRTVRKRKCAVPLQYYLKIAKSLA